MITVHFVNIQQLQLHEMLIDSHLPTLFILYCSPTLIIMEGLASMEYESHYKTTTCEPFIVTEHNTSVKPDSMELESPAA